MQAKQYSSLVAFLYFLNNNISGGLLAVPFVFYHAGLLFGLLLLAVVTALTIPPLIWTLETMARAQALEDAKNTEIKALEDSGRRMVLESMPRYDIRSERKFEVDELCRMFLGVKTSLLYGWSVVLWCLLSMWYYVTVAASAWAAHIPFSSQQCSDDDFRLMLHPDGPCWNTYTVCVLLFGVVAVPISMMELTEQKVIQVGLSLVRLLAVILMVGYCTISLFSNQTDEKYDGHEIQQNVWLRVDLIGGMSVVPVVSHALSCQSLIPSFVQPVANKRNLHWLLAAAVFTCASVYGIVGVTVASHFKDQLVETSTLSWVPLMASSYPVVARMISYFIVLYPSLVMLSAMPLSAVACSNYIISLCQKKSGGEETKTATRRVIRFCVVVVPLVLAIFVSNLVVVLTYGGLAGYFSTLIIPGLLVMRSRDMCYKVFASKQHKNSAEKVKTETDNRMDVVVVWDEWKKSKSVCRAQIVSDITVTPYTSLLSQRVVVWIILAFSVITIAITVSSSINYLRHNT